MLARRQLYNTPQFLSDAGVTTYVSKMKRRMAWKTYLKVPDFLVSELSRPRIRPELGGIIQQGILTLEWHATLMLARRQLDIYPGYGGVGTRDIRGVYHPVPQHSCAVYSRAVDTGYLHREREEGKITGTDMVVGIGGG